MDKKCLVLSREELSILMSAVSTCIEIFNDRLVDGDDSPLSLAMLSSLEDLDARLLDVFYSPSENSSGCIMDSDEEYFDVGSDRDLGTHDIDVMNGNGYYDEDGNYHSFYNCFDEY